MARSAFFLMVSISSYRLLMSFRAEESSASNAAALAFEDLQHAQHSCSLWGADGFGRGFPAAFEFKRRTVSSSLLTKEEAEVLPDVVVSVSVPNDFEEFLLETEEFLRQLRSSRGRSPTLARLLDRVSLWP